jgi:predicted DNA-binding antitoxin AbrB/MazE fold protein
MAKRRARRPVEDVPLDRLADIDQIDAILLAEIDGTPKEVHEAIRKVLEDRPGRKPYEIQHRFRLLKNRELRKRNGNRPWQRALWTDERIEMLRAFYAQGLSGARQAAKVMPERHPDLPPRAIRWKAAKLGLTNHPGARRPWTKDADRLLGWFAGEKGVPFLAKKLGRTPGAIRKRLSALGLSAKVPLPDYLNLHQVSMMLGVSDSIVRVWYEKGLFKPCGKTKVNGHARSKVLIHAGTLVAFCVAYPEKVNPKKCHADVHVWLDKNGQSRRGSWNGSRQHLTERKACPRCGRKITGNAYARHATSCASLMPWKVNGTKPTGQCDQPSCNSNV